MYVCVRVCVCVCARVCNNNTQNYYMLCALVGGWRHCGLRLQAPLRLSTHSKALPCPMPACRSA